MVHNFADQCVVLAKLLQALVLLTASTAAAETLDAICLIVVITLTVTYRTAGPSAACQSEQAHLQTLLSQRPPVLAAFVQEVSTAITFSLKKQQLAYICNAI